MSSNRKGSRDVTATKGLGIAPLNHRRREQSVRQIFIAQSQQRAIFSRDTTKN